jgi:hypothetical protein
MHSGTFQRYTTYLAMIVAVMIGGKRKLSGVKGIGLKLGLAAQVRTIPEQRAQSLAAQPSLLNPEAAL